MREIKFRAWVKDLNELGFVDALYQPYGGALQRVDVYLENIGKTSYKVENIELMQFTGLKDKNGIEIYEGDVVKVTKGLQNWAIEWDDNAARYKFGNTYRVWLTQTGLITQGVEVIGNIYENPELIK